MRAALALCASFVLCASVAAADVKIVGKWYDDLGSPDFADATMIIEQEGEQYFLNRRNGDGSGGRYKLKKAGNSYSKIGDKFGAKYVVTNKGLEIHDRGGYIRTARKIE